MEHLTTDPTKKLQTPSTPESGDGFGVCASVVSNVGTKGSDAKAARKPKAKASAKAPRGTAPRKVGSKLQVGSPRPTASPPAPIRASAEPNENSKDQPSSAGASDPSLESSQPRDKPAIGADSAPFSIPRNSPSKQARPLLAGIAKMPEVPEAAEAEEPELKRNSKRKKTKKKTLTKAAMENAKAPDAPAAMKADFAIPGPFRCTFRFINYNMANQSDLTLDDIGSGFVSLRERADDAAGLSPLDSPEKKPVGFGRQSVSGLLGGRRVSLMPGRLSVSVPPPSRPRVVSLGTLMTEGIDRKEQDSGTGSSSSSRALSSRPSFGPGSVPLLGSEPTSFASSGRSSVESSARVPVQKSKTFMQKLRPSRNKSRTPLPSSFFSPSGGGAVPTSVDCVFGSFQESQFPLEELAKALEAEGLEGNAHFHTASVAQHLSEKGDWGQGMKGKVAGSLCGDLKSFMLCRSTVEETEDGKVFCTYDTGKDSGMKSNPMKSFIGQTFSIACGAARFVCLGTHFPMQKNSALMEDNTRSQQQNLQKMKYIIARFLQKILRHVLTKELLDERTMIIIQGDLNSRCVGSDGKYSDLLWETLQDFSLQEFISMDLPQQLRGEWREVVQCADPGDLPATYRFQTDKPCVAAATTLTMKDVFGPTAEDGASQNGQANYREVLANLNTSGTLKEWGLYNHPKCLEAEKGKKEKFKPSRLPACTERVLYYAPAGMMDCCRWQTSRGYEVNYLATGSDHKPVMLEATLNIGEPPRGSRAAAAASKQVANQAACPRSQSAEEFADMYLPEEDSGGDDSTGSSEEAYDSEFGVRNTFESWSGARDPVPATSLLHRFANGLSKLATTKASQPKGRTGVHIGELQLQH